MALEDNLQTRSALLASLRAEVIGPAPGGDRLEQIPSAITAEQWRKSIPSRQPDGGEILMMDPPLRRYASGILHPMRMIEEDPVLADNQAEQPVPDEVMSGPPAGSGAVPPRPDTRWRRIDPDADDFGIAAANGFKPSAMGLSFVVDVNRLGSPIEVEIATRSRTGSAVGDPSACGFYRKANIKITDDAGAMTREVEWWLRSAFVDDSGRCPVVLVQPDDIRTGRAMYPVVATAFPGKIVIRITARSWPGAAEGLRLITVSMTNESEGRAGGIDALCLFQSGLALRIPNGALHPYPQSQLAGSDGRRSVDESIVDLEYSRRKVYAVGHGCSTDWNLADESGHDELWTDFMPVHEMAPMAFDVQGEDGRSLTLSMRFFAGENKDGIYEILSKLCDSYNAWILRMQADVESLQAVHKDAGNEVVRRCQTALKRMKSGLELLKDKPTAFDAFQKTNRAMLMAQHRKPTEPRVAAFSGDTPRWERPYSPLDLNAPGTIAAEQDEKRPVGQWRPFQLAFLLMSIESIVDDQDCDDREVVDLIWFPTGGGKTEAYLGLTAFTVLYNALAKRVATDSTSPGAVSILMRYTLRLLTAQQFQRAVTLFCALELIRLGDSRLGERRFQAGLWVGSDSTPNDINRARRGLQIMIDPNIPLRQDEDRDANPFVLLQCPWCSAHFGRCRKIGTHFEVHGYKLLMQQRTKFQFVCPDDNCEFGPGGYTVLPAQVVDEDLYDNPPTLLIGTVDKFAMMAWKPEIRSFFGIGSEGRRVARAPDLIIQDELHLMTGPLGTMVGLYETAVEALCRHDGGKKPKVVASTATAARAAEQVGALYGGREMQVFPPSGIDASDSFFARENPVAQGRLYVGVMAPGYGSMQTTQTRVFAALMQKVADVAAEAEEDKAPVLADPWWTLLCYFNSLRELGTTLTLFGADIPEYLRVMHRRDGTPGNAKRWVSQDEGVMELTSRLKHQEVPQALRSLEKQLSMFGRTRGGERALYPPNGMIDACLASNIVEVGVDVPRLSLMAIVGQPKTTSSYIQASSRVGRRDDRPGLVVMIYSINKPRDRSHYERFRQYHQSIYAWVEPTSVTPFSKPAVERGLHGVMASMARQTCQANTKPNAVIADHNAIEEIKRLLEARAALVAPGRDDEKTNLEKVLKLRIKQWQIFQPEEWGSPYRPRPARGLMYPSGQNAPDLWGDCGWPTPTSLRDVDGTCEAEVTNCYSRLDVNNGGAE